MRRTACLLVDCPDQKGLVAAIANFLLAHEANILHADQHQDAARGRFFMRVEWDLEGFAIPLERFAPLFEPVARKFGMRWRLKRSDERPKVALFVSRYLHCLEDLLFRRRAGELRCDIAFILSNHPDAGELAAFHRIAFHHIAVTSGGKAKAEAEGRQMRLIDEAGIELIVLARYMQVLSPEFVGRYPNRILNVHHSFLPAFSGARPYHQAFERGVKLIGATSHYVTDRLDEGPIIEQDVTRISHRDEVEDLAQKGQDLERVVLSRAVRWHLDHRILVYDKKTVVLD